MVLLNLSIIVFTYTLHLHLIFFFFYNSVTELNKTHIEKCIFSFASIDQQTAMYGHSLLIASLTALLLQNKRY